MKRDDCIFCKIIHGEIPSTKVYEDDEFLAFEDINPQAKVHTLVVPKKHFDTLQDVEDVNLLGKLIDTARKVAEKKGVSQSGYRLVINCREEGGQTVFHLHVHILGGQKLSPRMA